MKGIVLPCLTALLAALALAGCAGQAAAKATPASTASVNPGGPMITVPPSSPGTGPTPLSTTQPMATATATASAGPRCTVPELSASLGSDQGLASAGHRGRIFILTNVSGRTCYLYGYPGMDILNARGQSLHARVIWNGPRPTLVKLVPGAEASFVAEWADPGVYPQGCPTGSSIEITPPNAYRHLNMSFAMPRCPDGIQAHAVVAGTGGGIS